MNLEQVGSDVVAAGGGALDLTDLTQSFSAGDAAAYIDPANASIWVGGPVPLIVPGDADGYVGVITGGPSNFGGGSGVLADSASGDIVGMNGQALELTVPHNYASDTFLSDSATWTGSTFVSLGVTPGIYTWNWGSGPDADSFTLNIGEPALTLPTPSAVPEPTSLILLGTALAALGALACWRRTAA